MEWKQKRAVDGCNWQFLTLPFANIFDDLYELGCGILLLYEKFLPFMIYQIEIRCARTLLDIKSDYCKEV